MGRLRGARKAKSEWAGGTAPRPASSAQPMRASRAKPSRAGQLDLAPAAAIAFYVRGSTKAQEESCEQQLAVAERELRDSAAGGDAFTLPRAHAPERGVYADDGHSGWKLKLKERPAGKELLEYCATHPQPRERPGTIWVWALSRLARAEDGAAELIALLYELWNHGWRVYSHTQGDFSLTREESLKNVITAALQAEKDTAHSEEKSEAVSRAKLNAMRAGRWQGGAAPFGYERWAASVETIGARDAEVAGGASPILCGTEMATCEFAIGPAGERARVRVHWVERLPVNKRNGNTGTVTVLRPSASAYWVRKIFEWAAEGENGVVVSLNEIARRLNDAGVPTYQGAKQWYASTVNKILSNVSYLAAQLGSDGVLYPGMWAPLVSQEAWDKVQARLVSNASRRRGVNTPFPLSGLLWCARCGGGLGGDGRSRAYRGRALDRTACEGCRYRIPAHCIEPAVLHVVRGLADMPTVRAVVLEERRVASLRATTSASDLDQVDAERAELRREADALLLQVSKGGLVAERAEARLNAINARAAALDRRREHLATGAPTRAAVEDFVRRSMHFDELYKNASDAERKALLQCFVTRIEVDATAQKLRIAIAHPTEPSRDGDAIANAVGAPSTSRVFSTRAD